MGCSGQLNDVDLAAKSLSESDAESTLFDQLTRGRQAGTDFISVVWQFVPRPSVMSLLLLRQTIGQLVRPSAVRPGPCEARARLFTHERTSNGSVAETEEPAIPPYRWSRVTSQEETNFPPREQDERLMHNGAWT